MGQYLTKETLGLRVIRGRVRGVTAPAEPAIYSQSHRATLAALPRHLRGL